MTRKYNPGERRRIFRRSVFSHRKTHIRLHPLFLITGILFALTGDLFLFILSTLVALQHECAHAFAAAKLGYTLNRIVLMPFGAVIDGDIKDLSLKDEIYVAVCGPLCNFITALFFVALWWINPDLYAYTDVACYLSLSIAAVNLLPAYPLDGGRILKCLLARFFAQAMPNEAAAASRAEKCCRWFTFLFSALCIAAFFFLCFQKTYNLTLLFFGLFLFLGALGNKEKTAVYNRVDFSCLQPLSKGVEIKRVAVADSLPIKNVLKFFSKGSYLVLEIYDENQNKVFELPQNRFAELFSKTPSPYTPLKNFYPPRSLQQ